MNRSSTLIAFMSILASFFILSAHIQDTQNTLVNQQIRSEAPSLFSWHLEYSRSSITHFLKKIFNKDNYAQDYLALNFSHVSQGLSLAPQHTYPRRFMRKILNLFSLKLHDIYINPYAWSFFLEDLIYYGAPHTNTNKEKELLLASFKQTIGECLVEDFDQLQHDPDRALDELSEKLYALIKRTNQDHSIRELQHTLHYFLTQGIRLLIWSPHDQEDTWHNLITIAELLEQCVKYQLIDIEMLDDLYWALLQRYKLFLEVAAPELESSFFDTVCSSLKSDTCTLWLLEERERYITSKFEYLQKALMQAELTSQLYAMGHIVPAHR